MTKTTIEMVKKEKEVIRLSVKPDSANAGKVASRILKSLLKENKRVFLRYVNEGDKKEQLDLKVLQVERIAERMITRDPLEKIFDGPIPEEFAGKHITIYATLPHARKSFLNHDKTETITTNTIEFIYKLEENTEE